METLSPRNQPSWLQNYITEILSNGPRPDYKFEAKESLQIHDVHPIKYTTRRHTETLHTVAKLTLSDSHYSIQTVLTETCLRDLTENVAAESHSDLSGSIVRIDNAILVPVECRDPTYNGEGLDRDIYLVVYRLFYLAGAGTKLLNYNIHTVTPPPLNARPNVQALLRRLNLRRFMGFPSVLVNFARRNSPNDDTTETDSPTDIMEITRESITYSPLLDVTVSMNTNRPAPVSDANLYKEFNTNHMAELGPNHLNIPMTDRRHSTLSCAVSFACEEHEDLLMSQLHQEQTSPTGHSLHTKPGIDDLHGGHVGIYSVIPSEDGSQDDIILSSPAKTISSLDDDSSEWDDFDFTVDDIHNIPLSYHDDMQIERINVAPDPLSRQPSPNDSGTHSPLCIADINDE